MKIVVPLFSNLPSVIHSIFGGFYVCDMRILTLTCMTWLVCQVAATTECETFIDSLGIPRSNALGIITRYTVKLGSSRPLSN